MRRGFGCGLLAGDQPDAALIGEVGERPLHEHHEPIAEPGQLHDVHEEPEQPRQVAAEPDARRGRPRRARGRWSRGCRSCGRRTASWAGPRSARTMLRAACAAPCIATCATPGSSVAVLLPERRQVAHHVHVVATGNASGPAATDDAAGAVDRRRRACARAATRPRRRPTGWCPPRSRRRPRAPRPALDARHDGVGPHLDADVAQRLARHVRRRSLRKRPQQRAARPRGG